VSLPARAPNRDPARTLGRYALLDEIARGGMATVHLGRLGGPAGFSRTVAIKRLHPHLARDAELVTMLLDEARLVGRIQHPNVVSMLDVVTEGDEVFLVMEYVDGETLSRLLKTEDRRGERIPPAIASAILIDTLRGLHAAHEAKNERGEPLGLIHRDFTPHNIMVRRDGTSLVVDFGVAKAAGRLHTTEEGKIKGKLPYMPPEQVRAGALTRRLDVYAAGAVLWEALVGRRVITGASEAEVLEHLLFADLDPPSAVVPGLPAGVDAVVMRALERDAEKRFATAAEMGAALEEALPPALPSRVAAWLEALAGTELATRSGRVAELERELPAAIATTTKGTPTAPDRARPVPEELETKPADAPRDAGEVESRVRNRPAEPRRATTSAWLVGAVTAIAVVAGGVALAKRLAPNASEERALATASAPAPAATSPAGSASPVEPPVTAARPEPTVPPTATAEPSATTGAPPRASASTRRPLRNGTRPDPCPRFTIDSTGMKHYNPKCMHDD
jgi:serine/threonine-protein kinase